MADTNDVGGTLVQELQQLLSTAIATADQLALRREARALKAQKAGGNQAREAATEMNAQYRRDVDTMRAVFTEGWWDKAKPEQIGKVYGAADTWARAGDPYATAIRGHLRGQLQQRHGITLPPGQPLRSDQVAALLTQVAPPLPAQIHGVQAERLLRATCTSQWWKSATPAEVAVLADHLDSWRDQAAAGRVHQYLSDAAAKHGIPLPAKDGKDTSKDTAGQAAGGHADREHSRSAEPASQSQVETMRAAYTLAQPGKLGRDGRRVREAAATLGKGAQDLSALSSQRRAEADQLAHQAETLGEVAEGLGQLTDPQAAEVARNALSYLSPPRRGLGERLGERLRSGRPGAPTPAQQQAAVNDQVAGRG